MDGSSDTNGKIPGRECRTFGRVIERRVASLSGAGDGGSWALLGSTPGAEDKRRGDRGVGGRFARRSRSTGMMPFGRFFLGIQQSCSSHAPSRRSREKR